VKNTVFWVVSPCGSCNKRRFGGTHHLHLQNYENQWARNISNNYQVYCSKRRSYKRHTESHPRRLHFSGMISSAGISPGAKCEWWLRKWVLVGVQWMHKPNVSSVGTALLILRSRYTELAPSYSNHSQIYAVSDSRQGVIPKTGDFTRLTFPPSKRHTTFCDEESQTWSEQY
jgi:hypothetical protein